MSLLECPLCLEEYVKNDKSEKAPKVLPCGHTFCCECIKKLLKKYNNQIICPIDRIKVNEAYERIPFNRLIFDLIYKRQPKIKFENKKIDYLLKIGMIGNDSVGKTSLSKCYEKNEPLPYNNFYPFTPGVDILSKIIIFNRKKISVQIWDTAGQEIFNSITSGHLRGLHGCFIVYDVTNKESFERLDNWIQFYKDFNQYKKRIMIILGNKVDIKERVIKSLEAKEFAKEKNLPYFETSSMTMQNINEAFESMAKMILESENENYLKRSESKFELKNHNQIKIRKGCCS